MARRKSVCLKWTLILIVVVFCPFVYPRPQETSTSLPIDISTSSAQKDFTTVNPERNNWKKNKETEEPISTEPPSPHSSSRDVKANGPVIGDSIKLVANQLLENSLNTTTETPIVADIRIPPKIKNQVHKHKIKTRNENGDKPIENSRVGIAVPMTLDELEAENRLSDMPNESSTSNEGISTWILLSNPTNKENSISSTEPTKVEDTQKKQKPSSSKNKPKRTQTHKISIAKRPIIGSTNKSDLVAGGSAINENVYNKIKDTVLSNVQKNKNTSTQRTTTISTTTVSSTTDALTTYKEVVTKAPSSAIPVIKVTSKPTKKKNKNKQKTTTTSAPLVSESALLPMEPKEQEIELEVSTPPTTTKKPKRSSSRKKNKTKKRKTAKPKPENDITELKSNNKTKSNKPSKKPSNPANPITSQIYNYFSREVMPSVGVGVIGLASLVGLASYFLYPFATPVRRTFEVDKKDDLYRHNAEEYASEGNGQAEEEMLGTVLAGMPAHAKHKLNPYAAQTTHIGRYPVKKEQDIRYRHVTTSYEPNYNVRYPQQKTGIAHGAVYSAPVNYSPHQYETRHIYTTESQYTYDKGSTAYTPYPAVEPIYAAPQTGPSGASFGNAASNSVVYGIKPSDDTDFKPVYPYESQFYRETTSSPVTYPPTSMYLGSNNDAEQSEESKFDDSSSDNSATRDNNKFVVGNVPKELTESATPAVVPEHGPRTLNRKKRGIAGSIEEVLKVAKENNKDIFISNEIDEALGIPTKNLASMTDQMPMNNDMTPTPVKESFPVYAVSIDPIKEEKSTSTDASTLIIKNEIIESVSTLPIDQNTPENFMTESELSNELAATTPAFKVYEIFSTPTAMSEQSNSLVVKNELSKFETTTQFKSVNTETTTELKSETTSTMPPSPSPISETTEPTSSASTPKPTNYPEVITYPPLNQDGGFFSFLKRLIEFKYRLGLSILQTTSDSLNRYLRSMEDNVQKVAAASKPV